MVYLIKGLVLPFFIFFVVFLDNPTTTMSAITRVCGVRGHFTTSQ